MIYSRADKITALFNVGLKNRMNTELLMLAIGNLWNVSVDCINIIITNIFL